MHVNRQVRDRVAAELEATSLQTVSSNRGRDLLDPDLPAGIVGTGDDEVEPFNKGYKGGTPEEIRSIELTVTIVANAASETLDDDLDALRAQIEPLVFKALDGLALNVRHVGGSLDVMPDDEGAKWYAFLVLAWEVRVPTEIADPERALI